MKQSIILLSIFIMQSCQITNLSKKDRNSLYLNTTIPAYSSLEISTENTKLFSFDAVIMSKNEITIESGNQMIVMKKNNHYTLDIDEKQKVRFLNSSGSNSVINLRIYNHSSKIVRAVGKI